MCVYVTDDCGGLILDSEAQIKNSFIYIHFIGAIPGKKEVDQSELSRHNSADSIGETK
jgi:hypothetical protein